MTLIIAVGKTFSTKICLHTLEHSFNHFCINLLIYAVRYKMYVTLDLLCCLCRELEGQHTFEGNRVFTFYWSSGLNKNGIGKITGVIYNIWIHFRCLRPFIIISEIFIEIWLYTHTLMILLILVRCRFHNKITATLWT